MPLIITEPCWAHSKVKPVWHLFYDAVGLNADTRDGSACGMSSLKACEEPKQFYDTDDRTTYPPHACVSCKLIWDSWGTAGGISLKSPHPSTREPGRSNTPRQVRRTAARLAELEAKANGATPEEATLEGRRAYAASANKPLPTREVLEHQLQLAKNRLAGLNVNTHPPLISNEKETP